ncbi:transporter substrate-binding domain-containing protein [Bifidobacterium sp. 64T4]|uniref:transporter substrate-binding domain-containing protein n=1 Tax=Bifidobacterium pongonis TaxID=2834432 RepID=UPI001C562205|nr:transporter substrate-binding domain-containing protein [Bifidobacterium pongonis]MBW3095192.1 transporter substrate-binding domain-containing protein [Bifidobacterium pongonis]
MSRIVKKFTSAIAVFAISTIVLSGCGAGNGSSNTSKEATADNPRIINAATGGSPAPFILKTTDGGLEGQNYDLLNAIFDKLPQYKLKWNTVEFSAIFTGLDAGRYQIGVNNIAKNKEREAKYLYSDPIYVDRYAIEVANDSDLVNKKITSLGDLAGYTALLDSGTNTALAVENWNKANPDKQIKTKYVGTGSDLTSKLRNVENGQADFAIDDVPIFNYYKKKVGLQLTGIDAGDEFTKSLGNDAYCYVIFPKGEEQLAKDVNKALKELFKDGTSTKLNNKWFGTDLTPKE